jgi:hypothetical protein
MNFISSEEFFFYYSFDCSNEEKHGYKIMEYSWLDNQAMFAKSTLLSKK